MGGTIGRPRSDPPAAAATPTAATPTAAEEEAVTESERWVVEAEGLGHVTMRIGDDGIALRTVALRRRRGHRKRAGGGAYGIVVLDMPYTNLVEVVNAPRTLVLVGRYGKPIVLHKPVTSQQRYDFTHCVLSTLLRDEKVAVVAKVT